MHCCRFKSKPIISSRADKNYKIKQKSIAAEVWEGALQCYRESPWRLAGRGHHGHLIIIVVDQPNYHQLCKIKAIARLSWTTTSEGLKVLLLSSPHILALSSKSESFICQTFTDNNIRMAEQEREASIRLRGLIGR